jgi:hypothetical protein
LFASLNKDYNVGNLARSANVSTTNPHAPPHLPIEPAPTHQGTVEAVRREHLEREASIQALALLFYLIGGLTLIATVFALATRSNAGLEIRPAVWGIVDVLAYTAGIAATVAVGYGLRRLRSWVRVPAIVLGIIGSLSFPFGTLIFPYFLYVLLSAKGKRVLAPDYAAVVAATPSMRYPRSVVAWTLAAVLIAVIALRAVGMALGR